MPAGDLWAEGGGFLGGDLCGFSDWEGGGLGEGRGKGDAGEGVLGGGRVCRAIFHDLDLVLVLSKGLRDVVGKGAEKSIHGLGGGGIGE